MNRAYALIDVKSIDEDQRTFEGVASTPSVDHGGDVMDPMGAQFKLPMPLLWNHAKGDIKDPVGWINSAVSNADGIRVNGQFAKVDGPPSLKEDLDRAWALVKAKLVRGLSIGWLPIESQPIKNTFNTRHTKWSWFELSAVTIGMNQEATITAIKSIDQAQMRAASGTARVVSIGSPPGVTGNQPVTNRGKTVKTIQEQIQGFEAKRQANDGRMAAIMDKAGEEGRTLDAPEKEEYDTLAKDVGEVDDHLVRLRQREQQLVKTATPITSVSGQESDTATKLRNGINVVQMGKSMLPPGIRFTRFAMCQAKARGNLMQAEVLSRMYDDSTPEVGLACKAAVAAGTTQDATWAAPLVQLQEMQSEFVEFLRPKTLLGRIPNLRRVPFNIKFTRQTAGTTGTFVGEGQPKPLGKMDFELLSLTFAKAATIIVFTDELLRFSNPAAESLARDDLAAGIARYLDVRFIDPAYAGVANVSPASITNGVTPIASLGSTVALITDTYELAINSMSDVELDTDSLVWLMRPRTAISLGLKRTSQDVFAFPGLGANGGVFMGFPVITSNSVALSASPSEAFVVLMNPNDIMIADDGGVSIDMSNEASLQMDGAPAAGATSLVSLWQNNLTALRAERAINWRKRRDGSVVVITMNNTTIW